VYGLTDILIDFMTGKACVRLAGLRALTEP